MRVGVFGGSFNPPHVSHVLACTLVLSVEPIDRLLVVPTFKHPFAKALAPYDDRVRMCELAVAWIPGVEVSRLEQELGGESRTLRTLEHLAAVHPEWKLRLVIGADLLAEAPRWHGFDAIARIAPPLVLGRAGAAAGAGAAPPAVAVQAPPALLPEVSSTLVRDAISRGAFGEIEHLVPRPVLAHVRERGLYGAPS
jgi:nicotinate-nucleotide adenylyltransferase